METMKKLFFAGLCLLLCTMVFSRLAGMRTEVWQADLDSVARMYASAAPYALVTPLNPPSATPDDRLGQYLILHKRRNERLP